MAEDSKSDQDQEDQLTPEGTLMTTRIVWGVLIWGQVSIGGFMWYLGSSEEAEVGAAIPLLTVISIVALVVCVPLAYFLRNQIYKAHWRGEAVTPAGYQTGNIIFAALLEFPGLLSAVSTFIEGQALPHLVPLMTVVALMLVNFPHGRPMKSESARLGEAD